jgi:hypothetical protein
MKGYTSTSADALGQRLTTSTLPAAASMNERTAADSPAGINCALDGPPAMGRKRTIATVDNDSLRSPSRAAIIAAAARPA